MKKVILATIISFVLGVTLYNYIPKQVKIHTSGEIALKSKRELINDSSVIIKGRVHDILPSKWSNPNHEKGIEVRNIIQTDVLININEVYKGNPYNENNITVRIDKGEIGNTTMISEGYPDFMPDEEVILFLSEDDGDLANPNENYYVLTGMVQGKFSLKENRGSESIFANKVNNNKSTVTKDSFKLPTIRDEINRILDDLEKNPLPKMTKEEIQEQNKKIFGE